MMDQRIEALAEQYRTRSAEPQDVDTSISDLSKKYATRREQHLIDAAAAAAAVSVSSLISDNTVDMSKVTPQMEEAFNLAFPNVELSSLTERTPAEIEGFVNAWKGKYFEVLVRDKLNAGEWVGDISLVPGQTATLAESAAQPGWDLQILDADGVVVEELQLKATKSLAYVKEALDNYPSIDVLVTDEAIDAGSGAIENVFPSGISEAAIADTLREPLDAVLDSTLEDLAGSIVPGFPFVFIVACEGRRFLMKQSSFRVASKNILDRSIATGVSMGIGAITALAGGPVLAIPATFLSRLAITKYCNKRALRKSIEILNKHLETKTLSLQEMRAQRVPVA